MKPKSNSSAQFYDLSFRAGITILLCIYIAVFLLPPGLIPHTDHDHLSQDSCIDENDPCHLSMFHPGNEGGCDHKFHFSNQPEKCLECDIIFFTQIFSQGYTQSQIQYAGPSVVIHFSKGRTSTTSISHADRGPPVASTIG